MDGSDCSAVGCSYVGCGRMLAVGVTETEELAVLREHLPELFCPGEGDLLYVGANQLRPPHHARTLREHGWNLHLLETFLGNVKHHFGNAIFDTLTWGDVRTARFPCDSFDIAFWWHGCEHVPREDVAKALANLEQAATWLVVLGCPHGPSPQGPEYGNEQETHRWDVYPDDLRNYGYEVIAYEPIGRKHLLAWKMVG